MDHYIQPYLLMILSSLKNDNNNNIIKYMSIIIPFITIFINIIPTREIKEYIINYFKNDNLYITINIPSHEIPIVRSYSNNAFTKNIYSNTFLAITNYLTNHNLINLSSLTEIMANNIELNTYYDDNKENKFIFLPINNNKNKILIKDNIYCEFNYVMNDSDDDENNNKKKINFKQKSYVIILSIQKTNKNDSIIILKKFIDECVIEYNKLLNKENDNKLYIYEYKNSEKSENSLQLNYNIYPMEHTKDLKKNIIFDGKDKLMNYIEPFIYDSSKNINIGEEKYIKSGYTFKAGLVFYGSPGCGKTSTIKGILKYTNRNAIMINLNKIKTCEELESIFRKRDFNGKQLSGKQLCYVLEDCDAFNDDIISSRDKDVKDLKINDNYSNISKFLDIGTISDIKTYDLKNNYDSVNLSCFLNILDGIIELHGIMIIITTNYPEKIDSALLRPGRFDFKHEFKRASKNVIKEMIAFKFDLTPIEMEEYNDILNIKDEILSPAEIQSICFQHNNVKDCIHEIILTSQNIVNKN